jgi:C1A family cysteine protease
MPTNQRKARKEIEKKEFHFPKASDFEPTVPKRQPKTKWKGAANRKYNLKKSDHEKRLLVSKYIAGETNSPQTLPVSVDLRAKFPPVWDQGQTSACTSFATCAAIAYHNPSLDPSRAFLYWQERSIDGTTGQDSGSSLDTAVKAAEQFGTPPEQQWPFNQQTLFAPPPQNLYQVAVNGKVTQAYTVDEITEYKTALANGVPVIIGMQVFSFFESGDMALSGVMKMPQPNESSLGGHAVCLVGYSDAQQAFLVRNSWGTDWGMNGYFWLPYQFAQNQQYVWDCYAIQKTQNNLQNEHPKSSFWSRILSKIKSWV